MPRPKMPSAAACVVSAATAATLIMSGAATAAAPTGASNLPAGYHQVRLEGTYVIHAWGGAGGSIDGLHHGEGGYVCWRGDVNETVEYWVGSVGGGGAGGASTIVKAPGIGTSTTHPEVDMTGYLAVAGGGGGGSQAKGYLNKGGSGGNQLAQLPPDIYGAWPGESGESSVNGGTVYGGAGGMGRGGDRGGNSAGDAERGGDWVGGSGGGVHELDWDNPPGRNHYENHRGGEGGKANSDSTKSGDAAGGGGGGGFGGGGGGGAVAQHPSAPPPIFAAGGGGGGGSYVAPSTTPCTQADIDNAPNWDTRYGGNVVIVSDPDSDTVTDPVYGLEWSKQTFTGSWDAAMAHSEAYGDDDWRLPTIEELETLYPLDGRYDKWDPGADDQQYYWSSEEYSDTYIPDAARMVNFADGSRILGIKTYPDPSYRLVRDFTVTDPANRLEWSPVTHTGDWDTAMAHREAHGYDDWRLPTPEELQTLYPLDTTKFAGWPGKSENDWFYWTSEEMAVDPLYAQVVDFTTGAAPSYPKPKNFVSYRLVRDL